MAIGPVMLDLEGMELTSKDIQRVTNPLVGGVILFSRNIQDVDQLRELTAALRKLRPQLILAIDQEGGRVQRIKQGVTRLPPLRELGCCYDTDEELALGQAQDWGWLMASEMLALGLDISFAPVLDLNFSRSEVIGDRALHSNPSVVTRLAQAYIAGMHEAGMAATGKHFPGHGWVKADSHVDIPVDTRLQPELEFLDLVPFRKLASELDAIMPAHIIYEKLDDKPAGFSPYWLQTVLRQKLQFKGVIFSDDLAMEGASVAGSFSERAQAALDAGCDMVLACNNPEGADEVLGYLKRQVPVLSDQHQIRLASMLARNKPGWDELLASPRYQVVHRSIQER